MKIHLVLLIAAATLIANLKAQGQTCDCKSDLSYLDNQIRKLPSYKRNKSAYNEAYTKALSKTSAETSYYDCLKILNTLTIALNDWHLGVFQAANDSLKKKQISYPVYKGNLDSLKASLEKKSLNAIEGIYHLSKDISFGLILDEPTQTYNAVVLKSTEEWQKGDILYSLIPLEDNFFRVVGAQFPSKRLISYYERINQGIFLRAGIKKDTISAYYIRNPYPKKTFVFEDLSPKIHYVRAGSFKSQYPLLSEAEAFYKQLEGQLIKPNLILDLRDNGGGGDRNSDILLKQLKRYAKANKIHILTNARTGSNAEQFTVKLKQLKNIKSYGDKTRGALSYEIKPNDYHTLPSSRFLAVLPSKVHSKFLDYETEGVSPDIFLDYKTNWIEAVIMKIEQNN